MFSGVLVSVLGGVFGRCFWVGFLGCFGGVLGCFWLFLGVFVCFGVFLCVLGCF